MKYLILFFGKNFLNLLYSWFVNVLLCVIISVGLLIFLIMLFIVKVLFVLVVFNKVWWCFFLFMLFIIFCIVCGWLFCGLNLDFNLNGICFIILKYVF